MRKWLFSLGTVMLVTSLVGCGKGEEDQVEVVEYEEVSLGEFIDESLIPDVIATVNGEEIYKDIFVSSLENMINAQRIQTDDENAEQIINELKDELIERIVDERLLTQAADEKGIEVTEQEIEENLVPITSRFESDEELEKRLQEEGFSMEDLRADIERLIKLDKFIEEYTTDVEITEEQLQQAYDEIVRSSQDDNPPSFEEYKEVLQARLEFEQQEKQVEQLVAELRKSSDIAIHVKTLK